MSRAGPIADLLRAMRVTTSLQWEKESASIFESCSRTSLDREWPGMRLQSCLRTDNIGQVDVDVLHFPMSCDMGLIDSTKFSNDARRADSCGNLLELNQ